MTWDIILALFIGYLAFWLCGWFARGIRPAPTAVCKWCGEILYGPVMEHSDGCPQFRLMIHVAMLRAIEGYQTACEKDEQGSVQ